jgi:hypothetical protein
MSVNPSIYEINTRVFLKRFGNYTKINLVPKEYWSNLKTLGIDYVWLMGIWETCKSSIEKYCFTDELIKNYKHALKDWKKEDVIGSPFAIDSYEVAQSIGTVENLIEVKEYLNTIGIKLILDFVPNHFNADSKLIKTNPEILLSVKKELFEKDNHTYFQPDSTVERYFAHGRDPFFPAWQDTVQINFFSPQARTYLIEVLLQLTKVCDGVRCDMAMLALNNVFKNTWTGVLNGEKNFFENEFWKEAIEKTKVERNDFLFIAEAYWDLEWKLQQLGFDYTYDKSLTDRLKFGNAQVIHDHLHAEQEYQNKSVRFIENHDEERSIVSIGKERVKRASVIISTIKGLRFYFDGQFEGKKIKLPVQLGREPEEVVGDECSDFYKRLLSIVKADIFKFGEWNLLEPLKSWEGNNTFSNILAWSWSYKNELRIVVINYSEIISTCRIKIDVSGYPEEIELVDLLNGQKYLRSAEEIYNFGLYIELKPYQAHIFSL